MGYWHLTMSSSIMGITIFPQVDFTCKHTYPKSEIDNPGISGKAWTIPAESVSPEYAGMVRLSFRHFRQFRQICRNCRKYPKPRFPAFPAELLEMSESSTDLGKLQTCRNCRRYRKPRFPVFPADLAKLQTCRNCRRYRKPRFTAFPADLPKLQICRNSQRYRKLTYPTIPIIFAGIVEDIEDIESIDFRHFRYKSAGILSTISKAHISDYSGNLCRHCRRYQKHRYSILLIICRNCQRYRSIARIAEFAENIWFLANTPCKLGLYVSIYFTFAVSISC